MPKPTTSGDLFESAGTPKKSEFQPLADRVRPQTLGDFVGQEHLVGEGTVLRQAIEADQLVSMIFWGPPAVGKTTLAQIIARETNSDFTAISAVTAGVKVVRTVIEKAEMNRRLGRNRTLLFIDEIHRFNKAQQDALLHSVEDGTIVLIGATTENPSFEVISALLSRCQVYQMKALAPDKIKLIVSRALKIDKLLQQHNIELASDVLDLLINLAGGDVRIVLNTLELAIKICPISPDGVKRILSDLISGTIQKSYAMYDKKGDMHYDTISAFIKSIRGSDPDAALHYLARMLEAGEDPKFIARRLIILASEDIGNAAPLALVVATSSFSAITYIGMPEAQLILAQATTYLASAEKSNASYMGITEARADLKNRPLEPIPLHIRNAPTELMTQFGYADGYKYPHDFPQNFVAENYLPEKLKDKVYYRPSENGFEAKIRERLKKLWPKRYK
jgi:putative ATPase